MVGREREPLEDIPSAGALNDPAHDVGQDERVTRVGARSKPPLDAHVRTSAHLDLARFVAERERAAVHPGTHDLDIVGPSSRELAVDVLELTLETKDHGLDDFDRAVWQDSDCG